MNVSTLLLLVCILKFSLMHCYIFILICNIFKFISQQGLNTDSGSTTKPAQFDGITEYVLKCIKAKKTFHLALYLIFNLCMVFML